jgi:eukaryotic-like serine/threonine-protein kinase
MALTPGTKLGPYEIIAPLGAGGMGEVYRARDIRLDRQVAIKVLPTKLSSDASLKQRLEREAKAVSKLSHPHICTLHDIGHQDGVDFLVMEYLEGETLEQRLIKGPLPPEQTLRYATQIADALANAHKLGITHRDLKPANVMLTKSGAKLMDFGLAKQSGSAPLAEALTEMTLEQSKLTSEGMIVGTFQYMAPEQLEGKEADARTDIFAFGELLHEMATGKPAFSGKSRASLIASILTTEPPAITQLQPLTPPALERVVKKCLAKDPDDRWQSARDIETNLKWIEEGSSANIQGPAEVSRRTWERGSFAAAIIMLLVALAAVYFRPAFETRASLTFEIAAPEKGQIGMMAISPDGKKLAFTVEDTAQKTHIWIREMESLVPRPIPGTEDGSSPFWSPDGRYIGFTAQSKLKKIDVKGGTAQVIAQVPGEEGATWNGDGVIIFTSGFGSGLQRVSSTGGEVTRLTTLDPARQETLHGWPQFLPDGKHILFLNRTAPQNTNAVYVTDLESRIMLRLTNADALVGYCSPGYLLFGRGTSLMAQAFDAKRLQVSGEPFVLADRVAYSADNALLSATVSENRTLAYETAISQEAQLAVFDRSGKQLRAIGPSAVYGSFQVAPDEKKVATTRYDPTTGSYDVWVLDTARDIFSRLTVNPANDLNPVWSRDGRDVVFQSDRGGMYNLYQKSASGATDEALVLKSEYDKSPSDFSPDGRYLLYSSNGPKHAGEVWMMPLFGDRQPVPLVQSQAEERDAHVSPDGKWMAYVSNESGRYEVYATSFPKPGETMQISNRGGGFPRWRQDGKELFYISEDNKVSAVALRKSRSFEPGPPHLLFPTSPQTGFAVLENGKKFLLTLLNANVGTRPIRVVINWPAGEKK